MRWIKCGIVYLLIIIDNIYELLKCLCIIFKIKFIHDSVLFIIKKS